MVWLRGAGPDPQYEKECLGAPKNEQAKSVAQGLLQLREKIPMLAQSYHPIQPVRQLPHHVCAYEHYCHGYGQL